MIGIIFSTSKGAAAFVKQYGSGRFDRIEEGQHARIGEVVVAVTGSGKIKATLNTERLFRQYDLEVLLHGGGAVALAEDMEVETLVEVTSVLEGDRVDLESPSYPRMPLNAPFDLAHEGTLVTQDRATENPEERSYWERIADLRDTTGYAIAYVAAQHGASCHIMKAITARVGAESASTEKQNVYSTIATHLNEQVDAIAEEAS